MILGDVGLFHHRLYLLLLGRVGRVVLSVVHIVVAGTFVELQGRPILRIIIVGDPGDTPELQGVRVGRAGDIGEQLVEVDILSLDADTQDGLPLLL